MRTFLLFLSIFIISDSGLVAQTVIFSEDFEAGTPSTDWGLYRAGEEPIQAIPMGSVPVALANGGSFAGVIQDVDVSYTGVAIALAGAVDARDYSIEADVFCYVGQPVSAYTGLVFYADSSHQGTQSHGIYYKLVADFDVSNRFRLYNNQLNFTTFQYTFHESIDATGLYSGDDWHHMKVEVQTLGDSLTVITCYFDGGLLGQYIDNGDDQFSQGRFGLFAFQQDADGIAGYFDNIVVTTLPTSIDDNVKLVQPEKFVLSQNYPNPFNPTTTINFNIEKADNVKLTIYNSAGELVNTLVNGEFSAGSHQLNWNATDMSGNKVSAGVYLYSLQTSNSIETKKMILLK